MRGLLVDAFPDHLVLRGDDHAMSGASMLFDLMRAEALRTGTEPSAVMDRLVGLLFFYGLRQLAHGDARARGIWSLLRRPGFAPLVAELLREPARNWSVADMAARVCLSRATFFRQFAEACGQPPQQFLLLLRMQLAAPAGPGRGDRPGGRGRGLRVLCGFLACLQARDGRAARRLAARAGTLLLSRHPSPPHLPAG